MGFLKSLFGTSNPKDEKILPWIDLTTIAQLDEVKERSNSKTQLIFKHSTRCGISKMVINQFIDNYEIEDTNVDLYYLDLLSYRDVSNEIGYKFQVIHESPQLIILRNGVVVAHGSHGAINAIELQKMV